MFEVLKPGLFTTIQDLGRRGYQKYGVPVSGAVDTYAHRIANILVGNHENASTLEVTWTGLQLRVLTTAVIAITGGNLNPYKNNTVIPMWTAFTVQEGDVIHFNGYTSGYRAYIAIAGGIKAEEFLGSQSTDTLSGVGGMQGRGLKEGDIIETYSPKKRHGKKRLTPALTPTYSDNIKVRVVLGPQEDAFTKNSLETFFSSKYIISIDSDRMACRLEGPIIEHLKSADILSEGLFHGAIQVPKNGLPILLLAGRQSVGGYTKIGGVITVDLPKVAQLKPTDRIGFERISLKEAHELLREQENLFQILKATNYY